VLYGFDAVLEVSGAPVPSPGSERFNPHALQRVQVVGTDLEKMLDQLEKSGDRFVSAGPSKVSRHTGVPARPRR
jgi:hypothetical protein